MEEDEQFDLNAEDGLFFMNFQLFRQVYDKIFIAQNFPDEWWCVRFETEWNDDTSGGLPIPKNDETSKRYAENPQYLVYSPFSDFEIFVSLGQSDGRVKGDDGTYARYPFKERLISAHLAIYELPDGETKLNDYYNSGKQIVKNGPVAS